MDQENTAGLSNDRDIATTIGNALERILLDDHTPRDVAADANYTIANQLPKPIATMIQTIALSQGWSEECLAGCLVSNMGFLEHEATRLTLCRQSSHTVTTNVPILIAATRSARTSSLISYSTNLMMSDNSPCEGLGNGRGVIQQVATMQGIEKAIVAHRRASVTSDCLVNTYQTPWSEPASGFTYMDPSTMNTCLDCEQIDSTTGGAQAPLREYSFQHKVAGPIPSAMWLMRPAKHMFQKRMTLLIADDKPLR